MRRYLPKRVNKRQFRRNAMPKAINTKIKLMRGGQRAL